jgi:hypothetical protein
MSSGPRALGLHSQLLQIVPAFFLNFPSSLEVVISQENGHCW